MSAGFKRRDIVKGGLIGAATLVVPARALAQAVAAEPLNDAFDKAFGAPAAPVPAITVPAVPEPNPAYERKVLEIAAREVARAGNAVWRKDIAGIADFARPSSLPRFHFANLENGTVRSFLVAHGKGSDPEHDGWLKHFSNVPGSEATSRGGYLTCEWYTGKYGTSIRLVGLEPDNSLALDRAIVVHPAWYADASMISKWGKLGRSEGCFAMAPGDFNEALWHLSGGRLLYADRIALA
jgi:hypothetical protein